MYKKKKDLEAMGVYGTNKNQINKAHKIAMNVFQGDKESQRKRRIVDEEMIKAKELLGRNRVTKSNEPTA